ncbi:MAG: hypothetical protein EOO08_10050 [Chitinophagaceae bacterium]|nr:MAG: hypothetical protein EOO08_10050 [Chitinophagaceae bacterium]
MNTRQQHSKRVLRGLFFLWLFMQSSTVLAQPGWRDRTRRFSYELRDDAGRRIDFRSDSSYTVVINDAHYNGTSFPQEKLVATPPNARTFDDWIVINDCALALPQDPQRLPHIAVVHGSASMHLWPAQGVKATFRDGWVYFPSWYRNLFDSAELELKGNLRVVNRRVDALRVSSVAFEAALASGSERVGSKLLEPLLRKSLVDSFFGVQQRKEPIRMSASMMPFRNGRWTGPVLPTTESGVVLGRISFTWDTANSYWSMEAAGRLQLQSNTLQLWKPRPRPQQFFVSRMFADPFHSYHYCLSGLRDSMGKMEPQTDFEKYPYYLAWYRSDDAGKTWRPRPELARMMHSGPVEELEFLDGRHVLAHFRRYPLGVNNPLYRTQGVFYLLRDWGIVDSLVTPANASFSDNYNSYQFERIDSSEASLGHWGLGREDSVTHIRVVRVNGSWHFRLSSETEKEYRARSTRRLPVVDPPIAYRSFVLQEGRRLQFREGRLTLRRPPVEIRERGQWIYLFLDDALLFSADAGTSWYYQPGAPDKQGSYWFLDADATGRYWFWDLLSLEKHTYQLKPRVVE